MPHQIPHHGADDSERILVLCPIGLGNFILASPALEFLRHTRPQAEIHFLALKGGIADMARSSGWFQSVCAWDPDKESIFSGISLLLRLRRLRFTHSLALFPTSHPKFALFHRMTAARVRWGFAYPHRLSRLGLHRALPLDLTAHDTLQNLRLVEAFTGVSAPADSRPSFPLPPSPPPGLPDGPYLACHPGSSAERGMAEKRLPPADFAAFIRRIHGRFGWPTVLVGGPEEKPLREAVARHCPEAIVSVPTRSLAECAGVLQGAVAFFGNDSGLMHLAAALNRPCAAVFGPTDERRNGPFGYWEKVAGRPRHLILRRRDLACAPCRTARNTGENPGCVHGDWRCLRNFPHEFAWRELEAFLAACMPAVPTAATSEA